MSNCINSSKVYCKFFVAQNTNKINKSINSSKVYCKLFEHNVPLTNVEVLIVAKCIVNFSSIVNSISLSQY